MGFRKIYLSVIIFSGLLCSLSLMAQEDPALKMRYMEQRALKDPMVRQAYISNEFIFSQNIHSNLYGDDFIDGKAQIFRHSFSMRIPVLNIKKNTANLNLGVLNQNIELGGIKNFNENLVLDNLTLNTTTLDLSVSLSRSDVLFDLPVLYNVNVNGLFNSSFSESQFGYTGVAMITVKQTKNTKLSMGAAVIINPNTEIPAFIMVSYEHRFEKSKLDLIANFPYRISLRKEISEKCFLSFVNELEGSLAFFNVENQVLLNKPRYSTSEIKSGLLLEHRIGSKFILGLNAGALYGASSKLEDGVSVWGDNAVSINEKTVAPFMNVKLSVLPFL